MRRVACYLVTSSIDNDEEVNAVVRALTDIVERWLKSKGIPAVPDGSDGSLVFKLADGRVAEISVKKADVGGSSVYEYVLEEPTDVGRFLTRVCVAFYCDRIQLFVELRAGSDGALVAPLWVDARCPQVLRHLLQARIWCAGSTPVVTRPIVFTNPDKVRRVVELLQHADRNLPVVAVSESFGRTLTPTLPSDIAHDLCGLALVLHLDEEASWGITTEMGKEWACYNGAIRVYWPMRGTARGAFAHPLWTRERLLERAGNERFAASRIRQQLRRRLLSLSTYTFDEPDDMRKIWLDASRAHFEELRKAAAERGEQGKLAEYYFEECVRFERENNQLREEIRRLQGQVRSLSEALRYAPARDADDIEPEPLSPVDSVADAVDRARVEFTQELVFGDEVEKGLEDLSPDAGPPEKVYEYLKTLAEMTRKRRTGGLGKDMILWLRDQGLRASNESETILNNPQEMQKRTWHDGFRRRKFDKHLKPKEATSPDQCVRIYFEYDDRTSKTLIGWVGRHP